MTAETTIKIRDGDTLIVDAVLCRKTETGEIGWYDRVGEKFHPTPMPAPKCEGDLRWNENGVQYIGTGVQYIDTGIKPDNFCSYGERKEENEHSSQAMHEE